MRLNLLHLIIPFILFACTHSQTKYITFNVNPVILTRANAYLNILASQLKTYNWIFCDKRRLYTDVLTVLVWLKQLRDNLASTNVVSGSENSIVGKNNIVIGNKNSIRGINNWVFVSNFKIGTNDVVEDSILAIGNYQINLKQI